MRSAMRLADEIGNAPVIVLMCAMGKGPAQAASIIPAAQNMLLGARALGIGGTITTLHPQVDDRVHSLFGIPDTAQVVYCIQLGYPRGRFGPTSRKPLDARSALITDGRNRRRVTAPYTASRRLQLRVLRDQRLSSVERLSLWDLHAKQGTLGGVWWEPMGVPSAATTLRDTLIRGGIVARSPLGTKTSRHTVG